MVIALLAGCPDNASLVEPGFGSAGAPTGVPPITAAHIGPIVTDDCGALQEVWVADATGPASIGALAGALDGGWVAGGTFRGILGLAAEDFVSESLSDGFVLQAGADGVPTWTSHHATTGNSTSPEAVAPLADGGLYAGGAFDGSTTFGAESDAPILLISSGAADGYVLRYDPLGAPTWAVPVAGPAADFLTGLAAKADGAVFAVGVTYGGADLGGEGVDAPAEGSQTGFVALLDGEDGHTRWLASVAGAWISGAALDPPSGDLLVIGWSSATAPLVLPGVAGLSVPAKRSFVSRWSPDGEVTDVATFGGTAEDVSAGVDGAVVVAGDLSGVAVFGAGEPGQRTLVTSANADAWVASFRPDLTLAWVAQTASPAGSLAAGRGVAPTPDGGAVLVGDFTQWAALGVGEANETALVAENGSDVFLARFDGAGALRCVAQISSIGPDIGAAVAPLTGGGFAAAGGVGQNAVFSAGSPDEVAWHTDSSDGWFATWAF